MTYEKSKYFANKKAQRYNRSETVYMLDNNFHYTNSEYIDNIVNTAIKAGCQCKVVYTVNY